MMQAARTTDMLFALVCPTRSRAGTHTATPEGGREKEKQRMHHSLSLAHIAHAHTLSFATAQSLITAKLVGFHALLSAQFVIAAAANPFSNVFSTIATWMGELALPVTVIGLAISGIFMVLHHRAARDMLVGTIVGAIILFGASPLATAIQSLK